MNTTQSFRVKSLKKKDANRGFASIPTDMFDTLGIERGDAIKVSTDSNKTILKAYDGYDDDGTVIRIDSTTRTMLDVEIEGSVSVTPVSVSRADSVTFAVPSSLPISGNVGNILHDKFETRAVVENQVLDINLGLFNSERSANTPVKVYETSPDNDAVVIADSTDVSVEMLSPDHFDTSDDETDTDSSAYEDIGGMDDEIERVREMIELPMNHPELFSHLGIEPPKGVLLHGPPGTGKTLLARAVSNEVNAEFHSVSGPEIMSAQYGESEEKLRDIFNEAKNDSPAIIFFDEIDGLAPSRDGDSTQEFENRIVTQLLSLMDGLDAQEDVVVMGATNRPDSIDPALRRGGRFDREIEIGVPDREGRRDILDVHTDGMPLAEDVDLDDYAAQTHGFVGADLATFCKEAAMTTLRNSRSDINIEKDEIDADVLAGLTVSNDAMKKALNEVEPSAMREYFVEVPDVTWDDVGGLDNLKDQLQEMVEWPMKYDHMFDDMSIDAPSGILLHGPPGTGKTLLAKAAANEMDANFISVKGPEILSKWVGDSEESVRKIFDKARENSPAVIFFDEIDAIGGERGANAGGSGVGDRVVTQLLTELDGVEGLENVTVVAATNRPDQLDSALTRPGRFERDVYVPLPDETARRKIFDVHLEDKRLSDSIDIDSLVNDTDGYVGADIESICREAAMNAIRGAVDIGIEKPAISEENMENAVEDVEPSVDDDDLEKYDEFADD